MRYRFGPFELDAEKHELRNGGSIVALEPQVFRLLVHLISEHTRVVSKDELIEVIWDGRFVSDSAVSSRIKSARQALGDNGRTQAFIKTIHGQGFRFVATVEHIAPAQVSADAAPAQIPQETGEQPSIAVLPFRQIGETETYGAIADAVPSELISSLSRLRWLKVVARGSTFQFRGEVPDLEAIRAKLGATYCLTGEVEIFGSNLAITVELADTRDGRIVWGDRQSGKLDDIHQIRTDIVGLVTSAMELNISLNEVERVRLRAPETLDAWSLYHLGLRHMYRFNAEDNAIAAGHLANAVNLDPGFARAHAARSFTSFQSVFVNYGGDRMAEINNARKYAEKCLELDPNDPFGNFNYGRSFWLVDDHEAGQSYLNRAITLSPSFSQGKYADGFANLMAGQGERAIESVDAAMALSPLDPLLYAMQGAKGFSLAHMGEMEQACYWLDQSSCQPGAHYLVSFIAAALNQIAGKNDKASYWTMRTLQLKPTASIEQFFGAYPLKDLDMVGAIHKALQELGFPER